MSRYSLSLNAEGDTLDELIQAVTQAKTYLLMREPGRGFEGTLMGGRGMLDVEYDPTEGPEPESPPFQAVAPAKAKVKA